jgi:hypothetical protein
MGAFGLVWALALTVGPGTGVRLYETASPVLWGACGVLSVIAAATVMRTENSKSVISNQ